MVPPACRLLEASIKELGKFAVCHAIDLDHRNTNYLFYLLFSTGSSAACSLVKGEFFKVSSHNFSVPLHRNDAH